MPTARRSRTIAAPAAGAVGADRDPHHLPRWWPRVTRVEDVEDDAFTEVMRTRKGKLVRADFELVALRRGRARADAGSSAIEGTPFARVLRVGRDRAAARRPARRDGDRGHDRAAPGDGCRRLRRATARFLRLVAALRRRAWCAAPPPRRSRRRWTASSGSVAEPHATPAQMRWWGWGDARAPAGAARARARASCARRVGLAERPRPPVALEQRARSRRRALTRGDARPRCARSSAPSASRDGHRERVLHAAGKGYPDLVRLRAGEPEGAPDAVVYPARARAAARAARAVRAARRSRSCRSAAARASSAAWRRCAASTAACSRST